MHSFVKYLWSSAAPRLVGVTPGDGGGGGNGGAKRRRKCVVGGLQIVGGADDGVALDAKDLLAVGEEALTGERRQAAVADEAIGVPVATLETDARLSGACDGNKVRRNLTPARHSDY